MEKTPAPEILLLMNVSLYNGTLKTDGDGRQAFINSYNKLLDLYLEYFRLHNLEQTGVKTDDATLSSLSKSIEENKTEIKRLNDELTKCNGEKKALQK